MRTAKKLDLYRENAGDYVTPRKPGFVNVAPARYLAIDGRGAPGGPEFSAAIGGLYGMAFTIKMARKAAGRDYAVCKLEGLWSKWEPPTVPEWTLLIRTPDFIGAADLRAAAALLAKRGKGGEAGRVKLRTLREGRCVQALHTGPYDRVRGTIEAMLELARAEGLEQRGSLHEVYLSDPRRVAPAKLRTIVRMPVG
jgi:hypothetical protein